MLQFCIGTHYLPFTFAEVKREYYSQTGRCCVRTQTAMILTLKYHLSDNVELTKRQLEKLFEESGHKLKTGFVGTPLLCNVLSDNGYDELAYELLLNQEYPGWLNEVKLGATTVWAEPTESDRKDFSSIDTEKFTASLA